MVTDGLKFTNQLTPKWGDDLELSKWAQYTLLSERGKPQGQREI